MAGGSGSRFWPLSTKDNPKQFINLVDKEKNMIQLTYQRLLNFSKPNDIFIATNKKYLADIKSYLPEIAPNNISIEPMRKNTAACIGLASAYIEKKYEDSIMVIIPSDHIIEDEKSFSEIIIYGAKVAESRNCLVTLGIEPDRPETGYGYIKYDKNNLIKSTTNKAYKVDSFKEKPDLEKAKNYLESDNYLWNSGIFIWRLSTIRKKFAKFMPDLNLAIEKIKSTIGTKEEKNIINKEFDKLESISIDYGVMEKAQDIYVIPANFGWDDIGVWSALERFKETDVNNNLVEANHKGIETYNSIIKSDKDIVATIGIENLIIIETDDALLVCDKNEEQRIKELID